jgi:hypothetical protein
MITVRFRCGHRQSVDVDKESSPVCKMCGCRQIAGTVGVSAPRITGHATGPTVTTRYLGAQAVVVAEQPLTLKPESYVPPIEKRSR